MMARTEFQNTVAKTKNHINTYLPFIILKPNKLLNKLPNKTKSLNLTNLKNAANINFIG